MMDKKLELLDYSNCIANLPNSILKHFDTDMVGEPLELADRFLQKRYKNVVVLLLDAMGINVIEHHLKEDGFIRSHLVDSYRSVFPPTTVAATTSMATGLQPIEHGWLGWELYYPWIDKNVVAFFNIEQGTQEKASEENMAHKYLAFETVVDRLNKAGKKAYTVSPFVDPRPRDFEGICNEVVRRCSEEGEKYIYAYWKEPDHTMHKFGAYSSEAGELISQMEARVEKLANELSDTLLIITADHGHINAGHAVITDYPNIMECLVRKPTIEPRALNLFVKEDKKEQFEREFNKEFGNEFMLLTRQEVYEKQLFGTGKPHPELEAMLGDYIALATTELTLFNTREASDGMIGVHAGYTREEMTIPFIVVELPG